jgi:hypothetical protein
MSFDDAERLIASAQRIMEVKRLRGMQAAAHGLDEADIDVDALAEEGEVVYEAEPEDEALETEPAAAGDPTDDGYDEAVAAEGGSALQPAGDLADVADITSEASEEEAVDVVESPEDVEATGETSGEELGDEAEG